VFVGITATYVALFVLAAGQAVNPSVGAADHPPPITTTAATPGAPATPAVTAAPDAPQPTEVASKATPEMAPTTRRLLAGTVVEVQLVDKISSRDERIGNKFDLKLAAPIVVDGAVIAPAGATGQGEVIDVSAAGIGGHPGKLILAARYVEAGGVRVPLRGFRLAGEGKDNTSVAMAGDIAVGMVALLIPGGNVNFPAGTTALAKVAADVPLPSNTNSEPNR
jgi:hypothetical protein